MRKPTVPSMTPLNKWQHKGNKAEKEQIESAPKYRMDETNENMNASLQDDLRLAIFRWGRNPLWGLILSQAILHDPRMTRNIIEWNPLFRIKNQQLQKKKISQSMSSRFD